MPRGPKYLFGDEAFPSQDAVRTRAREIRLKHSLRVPIPEGTKDYRFVLDLVRVHIESPDKIAGGITALYVNNAPPPHSHKTCFWVCRVDKPPTDFGIESCLRKVGQINMLSLRKLVQDQVEIYKATRLVGSEDFFISDYSSEKFPINEASVDHEPTFEEVIERFFLNRSENPQTTLLTKACDASSIPVWRDERLASDFRNFHSKCSLRLVTKTENLGQIKTDQNRRKTVTR